MKIHKIFLLLIVAFSFYSFSAHASITKVYLNDSQEISIPGATPAYLNRTLRTTLTINDTINFTFEAKVESNGELDVELTSSDNKSRYLLRIRIDDQGGIEPLQQIFRIDCNDASVKSLFYSDTTFGFNFNFAIYNNFTMMFYPGTNQSNISVNGQDLGGMNICGNVSEVGSVSFIEQAGTVTVKNRVVIADNKPPNLVVNIPSHTWPEDTSTGFNISGNFSDANNDSITFSLEAAVENITIGVNQNTGIVNLTPGPDFFGLRYVRFIANDSNNITFSNNVTLNVTNVNDLPIVISATLSNNDFLNRTNGSLTADWSFTDADNDTMTNNETFWYIDGIENVSLRNSTTISPENTTKNQNWSFGVRVLDGTGFSEILNSSNVTIINALQFFDPALGTISAELNTLYTYDINYTDLDNEDITFFDNTTLFNITNEGIINFTPTTIGNITINITMSQNPNVSDALIIEVMDTFPPVITAISTSNDGTTTVTVTLSVTTDEKDCEFEWDVLFVEDICVIFE